MQRRRVRRPSPQVLVVALGSLAMVVTAIAGSQADPRSEKAVTVAMLSGGDAASLPGTEVALPGPTASPEAAPPTPESSPPTEPSSTTTTAAKGTADPAAPVTTVTAGHRPNPCPTNGAPDRPCGPPCPSPGPGNATANCPPPPSRPPPPAPTPTPCAYPTEPDGGTGASQSQPTIYCPPPCDDTPGSAGTSCPPPPPCERDASCPEPCYDAQPAPAETTTIAEPVPPSDPCPPPPPPPCPSATPTDESCTPPCSYEPASSGPAAGAFAPCASGVTGRVTAGPTCPVERPDEPCADKPVETALRLLRKDGSVAAGTKSLSDGSFRMIAAPGSYRLVADWPSRIGGCGPVEVTVDDGRFTYAEVSCDTGIR